MSDHWRVNAGDLPREHESELQNIFTRAAQSVLTESEALLYKISEETESRLMTIYRERANGKWEYWTYCDKQRIMLSESDVRRELGNGATVIHIK